MADTTKRIVNLTEKTELESGDYFIVDHATTGTRKIDGSIITDLISDVNLIYNDISINLYTLSNIENTGYILLSNGNAVSDANWNYSNYIDVVEGEKYHIYAVGHTIVATIAYYYNGTFVSGISSGANDGWLDTDFTIPSGVDEMRVVFRDYSASITDSENQCLIKYSLKDSLEITPLTNKKIGFLGDSFTSYGVYVSDIIERTGAIAYNYGVSGTGYMAYSSSNNFLSRISNMSSDLDYLLVFGGVNDFGPNHSSETRNFDVGSQSDAVGASTMYGTVKSTIETLLAKYPGISIGIITPCKIASYSLAETNGYSFGRDTNSYGDSLEDFVDAIMYCSREYSIPVLDLYHESGWNDLTIPTMTDDGLHPNSVGAAIIGKKITDFLMHI